MKKSIKNILYLCRPMDVENHPGSPQEANHWYSYLHYVALFTSLNLGSWKCSELCSSYCSCVPATGIVYLITLAVELVGLSESLSSKAVLMSAGTPLAGINDLGSMGESFEDIMIQWKKTITSFFGQRLDRWCRGFFIYKSSSSFKTYSLCP